MDVRIGVIQNPKELIVEVSEDTDRAELREHIAKALGDDASVLWLADKRGREVAVPVAKVAYVEIGAPGSGRHIGFGG